jgi:type IV pilus assembly protein PilY1
MRFGGACGTGGSPADPPAGTPTDVGFSSYFAIDVTVPERPVPLWEFSDDDLGFAVSTPAIVRTGDRMQSGKWYVVLGSGSKFLPKDGNDIGRSKAGCLYFLNLGTGELVKKVTLHQPAVVGDLLAVDADKDYETEKIYFGTSFRSGATWMGTLMSLNVAAVLKSGGVDVEWNTSFGTVLFSGPYPFTASPEAAKDVKGAVWIYAGSGKYFSDADETDASRQIAIGIQDKNDFVSEASLFDATHVLTSGDVAGTDRMCGYDEATKSFRFMDIVTAVKPSATSLTSTDPGWKISLWNGQRVISRPIAVGGILDFLSYKPDADPCRYNGDSYLYSVNYTTGLAPARVALRTPHITTRTGGSVTVHKQIRLGSGAPPSGDAIAIQPAENGSEQVRKNIQLAAGVPIEAENRPLFPIISRIVHWLKK